MTSLRYTTAGESHGPALLVTIEGVPAGLPLEEAWIDEVLRRRQGGPGRSKRQQIERDAAEVLAGRLSGATIGSPVALRIANRDATMERLPAPAVPRPGHADLAGAQKLGTRDLRAVIERASARETAARCAAGAVASRLLRELGVEVFAHVRSLGGIDAEGDPLAADARARRDASPFYGLDPAADLRWAEAIRDAEARGDTLGGAVEVIATGVPPGLGGFASREDRLDGRLGASLLSIPAVRGVEIGAGFEASRRLGSEVHDEIVHDPAAPFGGFRRRTNRAGGIEGGMTNGEPVVVRAAMKPIPTLRRGFASVELATKRSAPATYQRSDVCAVPAASVVAECAVAFELARAALEKLGGDTMADVLAALDAYRRRLERL